MKTRYEIEAFEIEVFEFEEKYAKRGIKETGGRNIQIVRFLCSSGVHFSRSFTSVLFLVFWHQDISWRAEHIIGVF